MCDLHNLFFFKYCFQGKSIEVNEALLFEVKNLSALKKITHSHFRPLPSLMK